VHTLLEMGSKQSYKNVSLENPTGLNYAETIIYTFLYYIIIVDNPPFIEKQLPSLKIVPLQKRFNMN
jgi:hypothetical protein